MSAVPVVGKVGALMGADENDPLVLGIRAEIRLIAHEEVLKFAAHLEREAMRLADNAVMRTIIQATSAYVREFHDV